MMKTISTVLIIFSVFGLLLVALPKDGISQSFGCCRTQDLTGCIGCESGCSTSESFCNEFDSQFLPGSRVCDDQPVGPSECDDVQPANIGCCVTEQNICVENQTLLECENNIAGGMIWVPEELCTEVPECPQSESSRNVPTLSEWGLIALAGILGIIGFVMIVRRKKAFS